LHAVNLAGQVRVLGFVSGKQLRPLPPQIAAAFSDAFLKMFEHAIGTRNFASSGQP